LEVIETGFAGLFVVKPVVHKDHRGFFTESFNRRAYKERGMDCEFVQDNHARSNRAGVLRGFHFQTPPSAQTKLVRVTRGAVLDVVVDLRKGSPTYGRWHAVELSAENFLQLFIPKGFAHAYLTMAENTEFQYKVDAYYDPQRDKGLLWNDPDIGVKWPPVTPVLSEKDRSLPRLRDFDSPFEFKA